MDLIPETLNLSTQGRIDLLLSPKSIPIEAKSLTKGDQPLYIIDFKTGNIDNLNIKKIETKADGLQIALYALIAKALGYSPIYLSLYKPWSLHSSQLEVQDLMEIESLWSEISHIQDTGMIGDHGEHSSPYKFTGDYPIATLSIPKEILNLKWNLSHPGFQVS